MSSNQSPNKKGSFPSADFSRNDEPIAQKVYKHGQFDPSSRILSQDERHNQIVDQLKLQNDLNSTPGLGDPNANMAQKVFPPSTSIPIAEAVVEYDEHIPVLYAEPVKAVPVNRIQVLDEASDLSETSYHSHNHRICGQGRKIWRVLIIILLIVVAILVILLSLSLSSNSSKSSDDNMKQNFPSIIPSHSPSMYHSNIPSGGREVGIRQKIKDLTLDDAVLLDLSSPQSMALHWILFEDSLSLDADDENLIQRYVLALIYFGTDGDSWSRQVDWLSSSPECEWRTESQSSDIGVIKCSLNNTIEKLDLGFNNLNGLIPTELSLLTDLTHLYLHENSLSGKIPSELGLLSKLQVLEIQFNDLEGIIPKTLGNLQSLELFWLYKNILSGTMPSEVCELSYGSLSTIWVDCPPQLVCSCCDVCF